MRLLLATVLPAFLGFCVLCEAQTPESLPLEHAALELKWGSVSKGVRVGVSANKWSYSADEDISIYIAVQNVSASDPIYGEPFLWRPAFGAHDRSIKVTVQDDDGPLNPQVDILRLQTDGGPSLCPAPYLPGKPVTVKKKLSDLGFLPHNRGRYKVTVTWSPYTAHRQDCDSEPDSTVETPYVSVTSGPLFLEIMGPAPSGKSSPVSEYTAWKEHFVLTDTPLGEKTALLDTKTHLQWLRLNLTAGLSYNQVTALMAPGDRFDGWRYATATELREFFKDFIGSTDTSTDPAIEFKLQRLMGGPLATFHNPQTGWYRGSSSGLVSDQSEQGRELRGYVADDRDTGAIVTPEIQGYRLDADVNAGVPEGSFLVQHH